MRSDKRLAVIDGNRNFHPVMRGLLRNLGFRRIEPFFDGRDAVDHMRQSWCDLAFVDLALLDGSGLTLIRTLRHERLQNRHMPIVLLTTQTSRRNIEDAMAAGVDYVLAKPLSPKRLGERMNYVLEHPLDYVVLDSGYFGPDPARHLPREALLQPIPSVATAIARLEAAQAQAAKTRGAGTISPLQPRPSTIPDVTFLD